MGDSEPVSAIEIALLGRIVTDRDAAGILDLASYQALYPGHGDLVAKVYARVTEKADESTAPEDPGDANVLAHFRLIRRLGQGGQGIVWLAEDQRLHRMVALKVLTSHFGLLEEEEKALIRARFEREAAIAARLDDPGLCKVFEVGESDGWPWSSMQYIEGESLDRVFNATQQEQTAGASSDTSLARSSIKQVVRRIEAAARAIHVAHVAGLVHRDLKPANIMLTPSDRVVVLDFGIARDSSSSASLTATGESMGSPAYMAPEQILDLGLVDQRTDVYALGVTLYEGLTGQRPFEEPTRERLFQQIRLGAYMPIRQRNGYVSADLAVVVACAMEMTPERRYHNALELAEDLARVLRREPIHARSASSTTKLARWAQRNPVIAALAGALFVLVSSVAAVYANESDKLSGLNAQLTQSNSDLATQTKEAVTARNLARDREALANQESYLANLRSAAAHRRLGEPEYAQTSLAACSEGLRDFEWRHESLRNNGYLAALHHNVRASAVDPRGRLFAIARQDGAIEILETATGKSVRVIQTDGEVLLLAWDRLGKYVGASFREPRARVWDVATGQLAVQMEDPLEPGHSRVLPSELVIGPAAQWIAERTETKKATAWSHDGNKLGMDTADCLDMAVYSRDTLLMAGPRGLRLWRVTTRQNRTLDPQPCTAVAASPDGAWIATGVSTGRIFLYDRRENLSKYSFPAHRGDIKYLQYSKDSMFILSRGADSVLNLHRPGQARLECSFQGPTNASMVGLTGAADGMLVQSEGTLYAFGAWVDAARWTRPGYPVIGIHPNQPSHTVLAARVDGVVLELAADTLETKRVVARNNDPINGFASSADGTRFVTGDVAGVVRVWSVDGTTGPLTIAHRETHWTGMGRHRQRWRCAVQSAAMSADGARIAVTYRTGPTVLFDANTGEVLTRVPLKLDVQGCAFVPDSGDCIVSTKTGLQRVDAETLDLSEEFEAGPEGWRFDVVTVSADGKLVAACSKHGAGLWSLAGGARFVGAMRSGAATSVAFRRDGQRLAVGGEAATVRVFDVETLQSVLVDPEHKQKVVSVAFSPDGTRLFAGSSQLYVLESERASPEVARKRNAVSRQSVAAMTIVQPLFHAYRLQDAVIEQLAKLKLSDVDRVACEKLALEVGNNMDWLFEWCWPVVVRAKSSESDYAQALRCAEKLAELAPHRPLYRMVLGAALYRTGDLERARTTLEQVGPAARLVPNVPGPANVFLAMIYHREGRLDEAQKALAKGMAVHWNFLTNAMGPIVDEARLLMQQK